MIRTMRADELRPGMILSTDGSRVESLVLCQSPNLADELCILFVFEDGSQKIEYVEPSLSVYVWVAE